MNLHILESENEEQFIWRLGQAKDSGELDMSWEELATIINLELKNDDRPLSEAAFRKPYQQAKRFYEAGVFEIKNECNSEKGNTDNFDNSDAVIEKLQQTFNTETSINKDGTYSSNKLLAMNETDSKDTDYILKAHGFNSACWQLVSARNNIRQVISKQDGIVTLYASYITVKPAVNLTLEQVKSFYKELVEKYPSPKVERYKYCNNGLLLEIPIQDVHFGKLSLSEDSEEPYNYNLAKERFAYVIDDVIQSVKNMKIEKIIFPVGSDFLHIDNFNSTTTAGTSQNTDLSPQLIFKYGLSCLIENITKLSFVAPVELFCVNGNHDFLSSYHLICALDCYFHNNENVTVKTETFVRKYVEFGKTLLGFCHGDKEKNRLEGIMQIEAKESWGRTKYREWHCGHLHSEQTREVNGIVIRNLPSFTGTDMWHNIQGYVGAVKKCESFLWDKEKGLKMIIITTID